MTTEPEVPEAAEAPETFPPDVNVQDFPPYTMTDDQRAATAGRLSDVDGDYAPEGSAAAEPAQAEAEEEPADEEEAVAEPEEADDEAADYESFTVAELKAELDARDLAYESSDRKADLVALLQQDDAAQ